MEQIEQALEYAAHHSKAHACNDGWVTVGQLVLDEETGEEAEQFALYLCPRCAEAREDAKGA